MFSRNSQRTPARAARWLGVLALTAAIAAGATAAAHAHSYKVGSIAIGHVWAPPPAEGADGIAVYGPLLNSGKAPDRLVGVSSPIAERGRFRTEKNGKVGWPAAIELDPGRPYALAPWRAHIWLSGLKQSVKEGDWFDLDLDFADAGHIAVKVVVEKMPGH